MGVAQRVCPASSRPPRLRVRLRSFKLEEDADIHLVVSSPDDATKTMTVELPNGACTGRAGPRNRFEHVDKPERNASRCYKGPTLAGVAIFDIAVVGYAAAGSRCLDRLRVAGTGALVSLPRIGCWNGRLRRGATQCRAGRAG